MVVGGSTGAGLSGGQVQTFKNIKKLIPYCSFKKRRLCVAIQLLQQPSVLFLDEPTSGNHIEVWNTYAYHLCSTGLDAAASQELLTYLKHVAESNRTVILTIHQPRPEIFDMFHKILVLCQGQV